MSRESLCEACSCCTRLPRAVVLVAPNPIAVAVGIFGVVIAACGCFVPFKAVSKDVRHADEFIAIERHRSKLGRRYPGYFSQKLFDFPMCAKRDPFEWTGTSFTWA